MRKLNWMGALDISIAVISVLMCLYHLSYTHYLFQGPIEHQNTHLWFALTLVFMGVIKKKPRLWPVMILLIVLTLISTGYIKVFYDQIEARMGLATTPDAIISYILMFLVIAATFLSIGKALAYLFILFFAYTVWGDLLPQPLWHFPTPVFALPGNYVLSFSGLYGPMLGISANIIFLFFVFGGFLQASGTTKFFIEIGKIPGRFLSGGPAMIAVVSSSLLGTITGGAPTNVAITGAFTIPLMKKAGYKPAQAGAIEAVASSGAMLVPPIMGSVAFVMSEIIGVPYIEICKMAIVPAILYYLSVVLYVQFSAQKMNIQPRSEIIDRRILLNYGPTFFIPVAVLTVLLMMHFSVAYCAFWAIVTFVAVALLRKETRGSVSTWVNGCVAGAKMGAQIAVILAVIGLISASMNMTGIALKLPGLVESAAGGSLLLGLILVGLITILFGCAVPPAASYVMVSILAVPALLHMGVPLIAAHWFIVFFSIFAYFTPPVGIAALVAAPLAGASYLGTAFESMKAAAVAMLLPFVVVWSPAIILQPEDPWFAAAAFLGIFILVLLLQVVLVGYYFTKLNGFERILGGLSAGLIICFFPTKTYPYLYVSLIMALFLTLWQLWRKKQNRLQASE